MRASKKQFNNFVNCLKFLKNRYNKVESVKKVNLLESDVFFLEKS